MRYRICCLLGAYLPAFVIGFSGTAVSAEQQGRDAVMMQLLGEVQKLRAEVGSIRNENEILRHRLEALISQLGVEIQTSQVVRSTGQHIVYSTDSTVDATVAATAAERPAESAPVAAQDGEQTTDPPPAAEQDAEQQVDPAPAAEQDSGQQQAATPSPQSTSPGRRAQTNADDQQRLAFAPRPGRGSARAREAYLDALTHLDSDHHEGLREALNRFLNEHPGSSYESKAHYWIAESYYTEKQYDLAEQRFLGYVETFPAHGRADDARLKLAYIYHHKGDLPAARKLLTRLRDSPNQRVRRLAERRFKRMDKELRR